MKVTIFFDTKPSMELQSVLRGKKPRQSPEFL